MKSKIIWTILALFIVLTIGAIYQTVPKSSDIKTVKMINNKNVSIGTIQLSKTRAGVLFNLDLHSLTPNGEHAVHVHEKGSCTPLETFKNAGGHYNPHGKKHGMKHPEGQHAGDMPNLKPNDQGVIKTTFVNLHITLGHGKSSVFDQDGSSIIIHASADDHISQPSGAAGKRIACGVIE